MVRLSRWRNHLGGGLLAFVGAAAIALAVFFALHRPQARPVQFRMTAGQEDGTRHRIAEELQREAARRAIFIDLRAMTGSELALRALETGQVDVALVQGGLEMADLPHLRQVTALYVEPLHLLVKEEIHGAVARSLTGLRGKVVNLGEVGSGVNVLAAEILEFSGLNPESDVIVRHLGYHELEREADRSRLPDAVFAVSTLPSPMVRHLVTKHAYRLVALPFFEAFTLRALDRDLHSPQRHGEAAIRVDRRHLYDVRIPAFVYMVEPGVPPEPIHTIGTRLLLLARSDVAPDAVGRLLDVIFNSPFAQAIRPALDAKLLDLPPELPWHDGTTEFVRRNSPLIAGDFIDLLEKEVSIVGVLAGGVFCLIQWLRRRYRWARERGFEAYIVKVADVERRALAISKEPSLDLSRLLRLQDDLTRIKGEALRRFAEGQLEGEELMSGFLTHVGDARDFLVRLILHVRENVEQEARVQGRPAGVIWAEASGQFPPVPPVHSARKGRAAADALKPPPGLAEEPGPSAGGGFAAPVKDVAS